MDAPLTRTFAGVRYRRFPAAAHLPDRTRYRATTHPRRYLHRVLFEHHHGPIPPGWRVIPRDGDPFNLAPVNLVAVPAAPPPPPRTLAQRRAAATTNLLVAPRPLTCHHCAHPFTSTHPRARYCSTRCRVAAHRARTR